jgi:hypothetical protein
MTDTGLTIGSAPAPEAVPSSAGAGSPPVTGSQPSGAAPSGGTDPLGELPEDRAVFDRGYVDSVRREAQRYRNEAQTAAAAAKSYEDVFGVYEPADRQVWFDLARTWAADPAQAAAVMQQIAGSVLGGVPGPGTEPQPDEQATGADPDQLTAAQVQQLIAEQLSARDAKAMESQAINEIYAEVRAGGIDPESAEGIMVLWNANHLTNGDIKAALAKHNEYRQGIIDSYVQGRASGTVPLPSPGGVASTQNAEPIKDIEDARKRTEAWLRSQRNP